MPPTVEGPMYLVVQKVGSKLTPVKVTRGYPSQRSAGCVVIRLNVKVPLSAFAALDGGTVELAESALPRRVVVTTVDVCVECGNDAPSEGYDMCSDCLDEVRS